MYIYIALSVVILIILSYIINLLAKTSMFMHPTIYNIYEHKYNICNKCKIFVTSLMNKSPDEGESKETL